MCSRIDMQTHENDGKIAAYGVTLDWWRHLANTIDFSV